MKSASQVLREAKALIGAPNKWFGPPEWSYSHQGAGGLCAGLAIAEAEGMTGQFDCPTNVFFRNTVGSPCVATWNNKPGRTHAEVMEAFDRAIALAEADEAPARKPRESDGDWAARMVREVTKQDDSATTKDVEAPAQERVSAK